MEKPPAEVVAADVFEFLAHQRGDRTVIRMSDGESGLSARTIARRLSSVSGLYSYLVARGDAGVEANPVPRGLSTRRRGGRRQQVPLVRVPRTLPKVLTPDEVRALLGENAYTGRSGSSSARRSATTSARVVRYQSRISSPEGSGSIPFARDGRSIVPVRRITLVRAWTKPT